MTWTPEHWAALAVLAVATFLMRLLGPWLTDRVRVGPGTDQLLAGLAVAVLAGLVATSTLFDGREAAGWARPAAVAIAGVLVWRRAPFLVIVVAAAATAAALRGLGVR